MDGEEFVYVCGFKESDIHAGYSEGDGGVEFEEFLVWHICGSEEVGSGAFCESEIVCVIDDTCEVCIFVIDSDVELVGFTDEFSADGVRGG